MRLVGILMVAVLPTACPARRGGGGGGGDDDDSADPVDGGDAARLSTSGFTFDDQDGSFASRDVTADFERCPG